MNDYPRFVRLIPLLAAAAILAACGSAPTPAETPLPTPISDPTAVINLSTAVPGTAVAANPCRPDMKFLEDITIPDNTQMHPGESFIKTWRFQNTGSCAWDTTYHLVWTRGTQFAADAEAAVPATPPGGSITVSVVMTAPAAPGVYFSTWQMKGPDGSIFGEQAFVQIIVSQSGTQTLGGTQSQPGPTASCERKMSYVADVTIPDGTVMSPGAAFNKTWRIRNTGTCAWGAGLQLVYISGTTMSTVSAVPVLDTPAGGQIDISVPMVAPTAPGDYVSKWQIRDSAGGTFGSTLSVKITIGGTAQPGAATSAPTAPGQPTSAAQTEPPTIPQGAPPITLDAGAARQIFLTGQQLGNRRDVFAKVGDSITESISFLTQIGNGHYTLGDYASLQGVIDYYRGSAVRNGNSFTNYSAAAVIGWSSWAPLDPAQNKNYPNCKPKSPLACEYDQVKPSVALIMLGTNDSAFAVSSGAFERNLSQIVEISIQRGIIPVLSTIPWSSYKDPTAANAVVFRVGATYNIPVMDYWQLMETLPNHGLGPDQLHPSLPPGYQAGDFTANGLQYGFNVRNLLALQMLDRLWREVISQ